MKLTVLDRFIIRGFVGPCLLAFFVVEFVLIMQTVWKIIDDILGNGYGMLDYLELLFYFAIYLVPMALPLTVLLSSVMVYGDMAEKYELSSIKSSGTSLIRILSPGLLVAMFIAAISIYAANFLKPQAFDDYSAKVRAMRTNKLTYAFDEKIFNYDFQNLAIRIGKKDDDGRGLHDILIYDMSDYDKSITHVIKAQTGKMYTTPDGKYLVMELDSGYHFQEQRSEIADKSRLRSNLQGRPVLRYAFSSLRKTFSLEKLIQVKQTQSSYRTYELMNSIKLLATIDTIREELYTIRQSNVTPFQVLDTTSRSTPSTELYKAPPPLSPNESSQQTLAQLQRAEPALKQLDINTSERLKLPASITSRYEIKKDDINKRTRSLHDVLVFPDRDNFYDNVSKRAQSFLSKNSGSKQNDRKHSRDLAIHTYTFHRMYSWAVVCVIFLFVGGPAGAIVKKGGFGYPLLIAIGFYLAFVMTQIIGNKLVLGGSMDPIVGAWLPCLVLLPFAVYLTWRALLDNRRLVRWSLLSKLYKTTSSPSAGM